VLHLGSIWARTVCVTRHRPATLTAALFLTFGAACVCNATQGGEQLWRSAGVFFLVCFLQIPAAGVVGFMTARRGGAPVRGIGLLGASVMLPAVALYVVSLVLASDAEPFPMQRYASIENFTPAQSAALWRDSLGARETLLHWGRASVLTVCLALPCGWVLGSTCVWLARRRRTSAA
jgi:hypothetical protein